MHVSNERFRIPRNILPTAGSRSDIRRDRGQRWMLLLLARSLATHAERECNVLYTMAGMASSCRPIRSRRLFNFREFSYSHVTVIRISQSTYNILH